MKITCTKERLLEAISTADRISGKNLTLPVLNGILLEARKKELVVRATNLELGVEISVPAQVEREGIAAVPGSILAGILSLTQSAKAATLEVRDGNLVLTTETGETTLKAHPADDFPTLPQLTDAETLSIKADLFLRGFRSVSYSASVSAIKPELGSVYLYEDDGHLRFVATDSFRLAEKKVAIGKVAAFNPLLIPARNVPEILRVLERAGDEPLQVRLGKHQIAFQVDGIHLTSRLIDATFPDYRQIIPKQAVTEAVLLKQDLVQAFRRLALFSDKFGQVSMHLHPAKKTFTLESRNADVGEANESLAAALSGDPLDINFNHRYVADCLSSIPTDSVSLSFSGLGRPLIIRGVSDPTFLYLVMPMNK